ncbi:MAG: AsmA family protein [Candidatus Sulfotelmatobacter sp.]
MKHFSSKQRVVAAVAAILLVLFFLRPGAQHLKARIANSVSLALARPVGIGSVHIRLLPQPGFDLENLVIYEDPAFGAEPMLRAQEVTALVRLTSLARGRLDIARLELTEPSLNLVRRDDGHWNLEALLERAAHTPLAPTAKSKSETRPGFPYIEASSGRINFKMGQEKKAYALINADFALWQESENAWGVRLKAEPVRTDVALSDTGLLRMNGKWRRAGTLRDTPLQFSLEWERAQLGQLSKLVSGNDRGWRGGVQMDATLQGTPAALRVSADASVQDFHRYDISTGEPFGLAAHCDAQYSSVDRVLHQVFCSAPVGNGVINLHGDVGLPGTHVAVMAMEAEQLPVSALTELARRAKKDLSADLVATGTVQGSFTMHEGGPAPAGVQFEGRGEIADLHIGSGTGSATGKLELGPETVPFVLDSGAREASSRGPKALMPVGKDVPHAAGETRLRFGPVAIALGTPKAPAAIQGWVARSGYGLNLSGEGEVSRVLRLARLLGLPALTAAAEGVGQMNLQIAGAWTGWASGSPLDFSAPRVTGTVQLRNVRIELRGVSQPIEIAAAEVRLSPDEARVEKLSASGGGAHWTGSLALPRGCGAPGACVVHFNLTGDEINLAELHQWLGAKPSQRRWYQVLTAAAPAGPTFFENLRATGKIYAARLEIRDAVASSVSASVDLDRGRLKVSDLRADFLGGKHHGDWQGDFRVSPPVFSGNGTLTAIALTQAARIMHDRWIEGTASGTYQVSASGSSAGEFWRSAEGTVEVDMSDGLLPHVSLRNDSGPLQVQRFEGVAHLRDGKIEIKEGRLSSPGGTFRVSGSATLSRGIDLRLARSPFTTPLNSVSRGYAITGTLAQPRVLQVPGIETQAQLKVK